MRLLAIVLLLFSIGCSTTWVNPSKTTQDFYKESSQCQAQAATATQGYYGPYAGMAAASARNENYDNCMMGNGWQKQ